MKYLFTLILITIYFSVIGQNNSNDQKATLIITADYMKEIPSIASQIENGQFMPAEDIDREVNPKRRGANKVVPGKGLPLGTDPLWKKQNRSAKYPGKDPILTFEAASSNVTPTDPNGAVGPNHFVNSWNSAFRIWDKSGNPLTDAASLGTIFPGQTSGDPIVIYDQFADRFLITEFFNTGFLVAITQGPDPVNDGWYTYEFSTNTFPDYPKYSLWSDGYYITANKDSETAGTSEVVFALERDKLLTGDPTAQMIGFPLTGIETNGFYSPLGFNVNGSEMPPVGDAPIVYMQDDAWNGVTYDHLKIWNINVDWEAPENSTISDPQEIATEPFDGLFDGGSFSNLPQPSGPDLDALQATIMFMAQYRRFPSYNTVVFNFVVDLDGNDDYSGIRWYELRQTEDGDPWSIYQEGTYTQPDGHSAYCGTMCMDGNGNIGMSYSVVSSTLNPSLRYTGRYATDELGVMTVDEEIIADGDISDPSSRYGDYSQMTVDPSDDKTFWTIGEYFVDGSKKRRDQVGVFKLAPDFNDDIGVFSIDAPVDGTLSDADTVKISIRNYGTDDQYDFPVSYRINDGMDVTEMFTDTLFSNTNAQYTFQSTGDFSIEGETYTITTYTSLSGDEDTSNDTLVGEVTHLYPNDIGVVQVNSPQSGTQLTENETISVTIENFGGKTQKDFDVTFILDGDDPVTEQVSDSLQGASTIMYTFMTTGDFSELGDHELTVYTSLPDDSDMSNDTLSVIITNQFCQPGADCTGGDGIWRLVLGTINNESGCDPNGYGDYTDMMTYLWPNYQGEIIITTHYGSQFVKVWIDLNDNFVFEPDEIIVDDYEIAPNESFGNYTEIIPFPVPDDNYLGEHLMRAKTNWNDSVPDDACEETDYGETEDYTVNIDNTTAVGAQSQEPNELVVSNLGDNKFLCTFKAENTKETLIITVHNMSGQKVIQNRVENINGKYEYDFDMSFAAKGLYLVRLGSNSFGKVKRILVQ